MASHCKPSVHHSNSIKLCWWFLARISSSYLFSSFIELTCSRIAFVSATRSLFYYLSILVLICRLELCINRLSFFRREPFDFFIVP